jgi:hypothetical protein
MPPRVDAGALTTALHVDAARAIADTVAFGIGWNAERGQELNEAQQSELVYAALMASATLETRFTCSVVDALEAGGVTPSGLGRGWAA